MTKMKVKENVKERARLVQIIEDSIKTAIMDLRTSPIQEIRSAEPLDWLNMVSDALDLVELDIETQIFTEEDRLAEIERENRKAKEQEEASANGKS